MSSKMLWGPVHTLESMAVKAAELLKVIEVEFLLVTLSEKGMALFQSRWAGFSPEIACTGSL